MKRGDLVQYWFDTGCRGHQWLYGVVIAAGPKSFTVRWESDNRNRLRRGDKSVQPIKAGMESEVSKKILAESKRLKDLVATPNCQECGACCVAFHDQDAFANVDEDDMTRMGPKLVRLLVLQPSSFDSLALALSGNVAQTAIKTKWVKNRTGPLRDFKLCRCKALDGDVLNQVSCSIYETRPRVCREAVKPGDRVCREVRRAMFDHAEGAS